MKKTLLAGMLCLALCSWGFSSGVSFQATGGLSLLMGGDFNKYMDSENYYYQHATLFNVDSPFEHLNLGMAFGGEVIYHLTDAFGIGIGSGYISASKETTLQIHLGAIRGTLMSSLDLAAIPLVLNFHYFLAAGPRINFHLFAGPGLYFSNVKYDLGEKAPIFLTNVTDTFRPDARTVLGLQGGLGLELGLSPSLFLVLDACGRLVNISGLSGVEHISGVVGGNPVDISRTSRLWYSEKLGGGQTTVYLDLNPDRPSFPGIQNVRDGSFSLSGVTFQAGFRIRL